MGGGGGRGVTNIRMNANVVGLGPNFKLKVELTNGGGAALSDLNLVVAYKPEVYKSERPVAKVPLLLPNVTQFYEVALLCVHPEGAADPVRIVLVNDMSSVPLYSGVVQMPMSELAEE